jgi:hypothetical protein
MAHCILTNIGPGGLNVAQDPKINLAQLDDTKIIKDFYKNLQTKLINITSNRAI